MSAVAQPSPVGFEATLAKRVPSIALVFLAALLAVWWLTSQGAPQHPWDDAMKRHDHGEQPPSPPPQSEPPQAGGCGGCDCSGVDCSGCDGEAVGCVAEGLCEVLGGLASCSVASGARAGASCPRVSPIAYARSWAVLLAPLALMIAWRRRARRAEAAPRSMSQAA